MNISRSQGGMSILPPEDGCFIDDRMARRCAAFAELTDAVAGPFFDKILLGLRVYVCEPGRMWLRLACNWAAPR